MDATEGARISLPAPDPTPQPKPEARRSQEAEAAPWRESAGAPSTSLAEASVRVVKSSRFWRTREKAVAKRVSR